LDALLAASILPTFSVVASCSELLAKRIEQR